MNPYAVTRKPLRNLPGFGRVLRVGLLIGTLWSILLSGAAYAQANGASLKVGDASGLPGTSGLTIPIKISSSTAVSGVNFDLNFNASSVEVTGVSAGSAAEAGNKDVNHTIGSGTLTVVVAGLNTDPIPNGTLVVVAFSILPQASPGVASLTLSDVAATDPSGGSVTVSTSNGSIAIEQPPASATPTSIQTRAPSPTLTSTSTPTLTRTNTPTLTRTNTPTNTPSATRTPSKSATAGASSTASRTTQPSQTPTPSHTPTASRTSTSSFRPTPSPTGPTSTRGPSQTPNPNATPTLTPQSDQSTRDASKPAGPEGPVDPSTDGLESAVVKTSTALAEVDSAVRKTSTALAGPIGSANLSPARQEGTLVDQVVGFAREWMGIPTILMLGVIEIGLIGVLVRALLS